MKRLLLILFVSALIIPASAQEIRMNLYGGYVFKDKVDSYYSSSSYFEGTIQDGFRWGAGLEVHIPRRGAVELQYLRQDTEAPTVYTDGFFGGDIQRTTFDIGINWIMLNGTRYFPVSDVFEPFAGAGFGMGIFSVKNPDNGRSDTATKFSWQIRGGSNIWFSERAAFRIQMSLVSATQAIGGGLYFGTGGVGTGLSSYSTMYQFAFDGGIVIKLKTE